MSDETKTYLPVKKFNLIDKAIVPNQLPILFFALLSICFSKSMAGNIPGNRQGTGRYWFIEKFTDSTVESDNTYGKGGTKTVKVSDHWVKWADSKDSTHQLDSVIIYRDSKGREWEKKIIETHVDSGQKWTYNFKMDEKGDLVYYNWVKKDILGTTTYSEESKWKDKKHIYGIRQSYEYGGYKYIYDVKKGDWEEEKKVKPPPDDTKKETTPSIPASFLHNQVVLGPAYMHFGDKDFHYGSYGFTGEYSRFLCPRFAVTADIGIYWHKESFVGYDEDFDECNFDAGVTYLPCSHSLDPTCLFCFSAHAFGGYGSYTVKTTSNGYGSNSNKEHSIIFDAGVAEDLRVSPNFKLRLQADYRPSFYFKSTQNNYRLTLGGAYNF